MTRNELLATLAQANQACAEVKKLRDLLREHRVIAPGGNDFNDALREIVSVDARLAPFALEILRCEPVAA